MDNHSPARGHLPGSANLAKYSVLYHSKRPTMRVFEQNRTIVHGDRVNPTPYYMENYSVATSPVVDAPNSDVAYIGQTKGHFVFTNSHAKAYNDFVEGLGISSSLGSSVFAEGRKSVEQLADYVHLINNIMRALRGNPKAIAELNYTLARLRTHSRGDFFRSLAKNGGSVWLQWSYGLKPIYDMIVDIDRFLGSTPPSQRVVGRGKSSARVTGILAEAPARGQVTVFTRIQADVRVADIGAYTQARLGLSNPLEWALEALPFSFVADWFSNLGDVVGSLDDFNGIELHRPATTTLYRGHLKTSDDGLIDIRPSKFGVVRADATIMERRLVIQRPTLHIDNPFGVSGISRAMNQISLLTQFLTNPVTAVPKDVLRKLKD